MRHETGKNGDLIDLGQLRRTTGFLVRRLHNSLISRWNRDVDGPAAGVTPVQAGLLILIAENPGVTQSRLLKVLDVESATLVKSITRLVDANYIVKNRVDADRRAFHLHLTPTGEAAHKLVAAKLLKRDARLSEGIDPEDYKVFHKVLLQLIRARSQNGAPF